MTCQRMAVGTLLLWATAFAAQTSPSGTGENGVLGPVAHGFALFL
jgi:hypothetical protein